MSKREHRIVRMCGHCLGSGTIYLDGKRKKCHVCKGEGVVTEIAIIDDGQPEPETEKTK